ncbi:MBL fold metallo-hydrolase [Luteimonas sp. MJ250]|uniref:MBL fold metallo-hydrolase n=1 Tax=Luteimonas sp. MJ250 TaxID=3129236 RepID=UPI0031BAA4E0
MLYDRDGGHAAVIDPVLDYDPASARTSTGSAERVLEFARSHDLPVDWILETHAHADHLTAAAHLRRGTGAKVAIGRGITQVQDSIHGGRNVGEDTFVKMRTRRDATLAPPKLILPALQVNIRAGELPPPDINGVRYLRLPLNQLGDGH